METYFDLLRQKDALVQKIRLLKESIERKANAKEFGDVWTELKRNPSFKDPAQFLSNLFEFIGPLNNDEICLAWLCAFWNGGMERFPQHPLVRVFFLTEHQLTIVSTPDFKGDKQLKRYLNRQGDALKEGDLPAFLAAYEDEFKETKKLQSLLSRRAFLKSAGASAALLALRSSSMRRIVPTNKKIFLAIRGINYDVGTRYDSAFITRGQLTFPLMASELRQIRDELHCNAVRIYGEGGKLIDASLVALELGMQVWLSPRFINADASTTKARLEEYAKSAEKLRIKYAPVSPFRENAVIFLVGNELTLDMAGLVAGSSYQERAGNIWKHIAGSILNPLKKDKVLNLILQEYVRDVRRFFGGKISYAAAEWEIVDWGQFDVISVNYYHTRLNAINYKKRLIELKEMGKPIVITEFGTSSYEGAAAWGGASYNIVEWRQNDYSYIRDNNWNGDASKEPQEKYKRNEDVQANYIQKLLDIFIETGVYGAFVFCYVEPQYTYHEEILRYKKDKQGIWRDCDIDKASLGIMKVHSDPSTNQPIEANKWPKAAFYAVANFYRVH